MESNILARMHTGEHIFFKSLEKEAPSLKLDKIKLDEKESVIFVFADNITWDNIFKAEITANKIIKEDREVKEHIAKKEEVKQKFPGIRIKVERIKESTVRIIEVKDFDHSACSGDHCSSTSEVKNLLVTKFNSAGPNKYEIRFKVDIEEDLVKLSQVARKTASILGTEYDKVEQTLMNMKFNLEKYKKMARDVKVEAKEEVINGIKLKSNLVEVEPKQLLKQANDLVEEKTVVFFINKTEKLPQILILVSDDLELEASEILKKVTEKFNGKGGGKKNMAQGSIETNKFDEVFEYVKELI